MKVDGLLQEAIRFHRLGSLAEAERLYASILQQDPDHADALHLLGVMACKVGRYQGAMDCISKAIAINPNAPEYYNSLGVVQQGIGNEAEAVGSYLQAIALKDDYIEPYSNLLRLRPAAVEVRFNLALVLHRQRRMDEAVTHYSRVVELQPDHPGALNNLGCALRDLGRCDEAIIYLRQAVQQQPEYAEALHNLGYVLQEKGNLDEAVACYEAALALKPDFADAHADFGKLLQSQGHIDKAISHYQRAVDIVPNHLKAYYNWACALHEQGRDAAAIDKYAEANRCDASYVEAHVNRALVLLINARFLEGWAEYEWRVQRPDWLALNSYYPELPRWDGSEMPHKCIMVQAEQGFGDTMQFARYLPGVRSRCGKLIVEAPPELHPLLATIPAIDELVARQPENAGKADLCIHIMSLPRVFGTTVDSIPLLFPYLGIPGSRMEKWKKKIPAQGLKIGVAWSGNPAYPGNEERSFPLMRFAALAAIPAVRLFSLQKGEAAGQLIGCALPIVDLGPDLDDFADTAAVIMHLDLIVSVDTALVHLAGALGRPIWTIRCHTPYWVWGKEGPGTRWYPSMRMFRQQKPGAWEELFEEVAGEVVRMLQKSAGEDGLVPSARGRIHE